MNFFNSITPLQSIPGMFQSTIIPGFGTLTQSLPDINYYQPITIYDNDSNCGICPPGPPGPIGPPGPPGPAGSSILPVTIITTISYTTLPSDYFLGVNVAAPSSIILAASPPIGRVFIVKDISGDASINPIIISASTTIDGVSTKILNIDYSSVTLVFNGTEWNVV